ncbi:hypothetical protein INT48_005258 [Thamnidium elegans]|uniref:Uncharacterized protein n=1 Tax=Thamnidium elegans TaxID=101142 RepID=A0A8H7SKB7_9FUNG|nr:hypothetical protein INT48_005258 [Thamnidium elegans]
MRYSFAIVSVALLALSVNGTNLVKSQIADRAKKCILNINAVSSQFQILKTSVDGFVIYEDYDEGVAIHKKEQLLEDFLQESCRNCCTQAARVTDDQIVAEVDSISLLSADVAGALCSIREKKYIFDYSPVTYAYIRAYLVDLDTQVDRLFGCLTSKTPEQYLPYILGHRANTDQAFSETKFAYGV